MKRIFILLITIVFISCSKENHNNIIREINHTNLQLKNGIAYENNKPFTGKVIENDKNGLLFSETFYSNGKTNGEQKIYFDSGKVRLIINYKDGEQHGDEIEYWEADSAKIKMKRSYKNGQFHGDEIEYFENGKIFSKKTYKDGKLHGESVLYYDNGEIWTKDNYVNGIKQN